MTTETKTLNAAQLAKMKEKITLLLNKAENTPYPAEAEAFQEHAERLMVRYGIAKAHLDDAEGKRGKKQEPVIEETFTINGVMRVGVAQGMTIIARAFPAITVLESNGWNAKNLHIIGHESDVKTVIRLFNSVSIQMTTALTAWWKDAPKSHLVSDTMRKNERRQFLYSFLGRVGKRVAELYREEQDASTGSALVFVGREERVDQYVSNAYPGLRSSKSRMQGGSSLAAMAGYDAGGRADIGQGRGVDASKVGALN